MNLKLDQKRYRIFMDESYAVEKDSEARAEKWRYYELRGQHGSIWSYSKDELALLVTSITVSNRLKRAKEWRVRQSGDFETVFLIPNAELELGASLIKARKRRIVTPEQAAKMSERLNGWRAKK